jgi:hypothetical protein
VTTNSRPTKTPKQAANSEKSGSEQGAKRASTGRKRAPIGPKRARSGWRPTAGAALRAQLGDVREPAGIGLLVDQAARVADRLEVLDRLHRGDADAWLRLEVARVVAPETPARERKAFYVDVALKIEPTIAEEARQSKLLASLLGDIFRQRATVPASPPSSTNGHRPRIGDLDVDHPDYDNGH